MYRYIAAHVYTITRIKIFINTNGVTVSFIRIKVDTLRGVDPVLHNLNLEAFQKHFREDLIPDSSSGEPAQDHTGSTAVDSQSQNILTTDTDLKVIEEKALDLKSLTSLDSGIGGALNTSPPSDLTIQTTTTLPKNHQSKLTNGDKSGSFRSSSRPNPFNLDRSNSLKDDLREHLLELSYSAENLDQLDNHTGVLHVWFLVLEGLASTVSTCPRGYQPQTLEMLFELMRAASKVPGMLWHGTGKGGGGI